MANNKNKLLMRFHEMNFNKFSLPTSLDARMLQFATRSAGDKTIERNEFFWTRLAILLLLPLAVSRALWASAVPGCATRG